MGLTMRLDLGGIPILTVLQKEEKKNIYPTKPLVDLEFNPASCVLFGTRFTGAPATAGWHLDPVLVDGIMAISPISPASCLLVSPCPFPNPAGREANKSATAKGSSVPSPVSEFGS